MSRIIEIVISPQGETKLQTKGFAGAECQNASKFLEQGLGNVLAEQKFAEFFAEAEQRQTVNQ